MINSIRRFLLISLLLSITIGSSLSAIGNYYLDGIILQNHLDQNLLQDFYFIKIITRSAKNSTEIQKNIRQWFSNGELFNQNNLFFQVYSSQGSLLYFSEKNLDNNLKKIKPGFNNLLIHDKKWRIYANQDPLSGNLIIIAEKQTIRNQLIDDIARNDVYLLLFTYPLFGALIWLIIGIALRSIICLTKEISNRAANHLDSLEIKEIPDEIKPLVDELNRLFLRLKIAFARDKRFAGDAAHELRTPLAAIKAQAQVALKEQDPIAKKIALEKVIQGVDRSSHIVSQLLTLSRINHEDELNDISVVNLQHLATEIIGLLVPSALEKNITITMEKAPPHINILGNEISLSILIRNIVDNAIRYTKNNGKVQIEILNKKNKIIFQVIDSGPGIPIALHNDVFNRFYRILGTKEQGSGLGLAIVKQISKLHHATITLSSPEKHSGLIFSVHFPMINREN